MAIYTNIDWKENTSILSSPKDMSAIPISVSYSFSLSDNMQSPKYLLLHVLGWLHKFLNVCEKSTLDAF